MSKIVMQVHRGSEIYSVDNEGNIGRPSIGMKPSEQWKFLGICRFNNYGTIVQNISFRELRDPDILASVTWHYKNGKCMWRGMDRDHGTRRIWAMPNDLHLITLEG